MPPTGAIAGAPLTGQPAVQLVDANGLVVGFGPGSTASITISLAGNAAGATLTCPGGLTRVAVGGVATFDACAIDRPGSGYVIRADAAALPQASSAPFEILDPGSALPLTLAARRSTITPGTTVTFRSIVRPVGAGLPRAMVSYAIYRRVGTAWVPYRRMSVATDTSGTARLVWRFSLPGSWYVRSSAAATTSNGSSTWSIVARFDVR